MMSADAGGIGPDVSVFDGAAGGETRNAGDGDLDAVRN
jgi:hypothetical protein